MDLRVRLLGKPAAWRAELELDLGPARQRSVFTVLAMRANQVVTRAALIEAVWGESAPRGASTSLYSYISRLRLALGRSTEALVSVGSGYSLRLEPGALDVHEFDELRDAAQECWLRRDVNGARIALDKALALWHGDALTGVDSAFAELHRKRLAELRLAALELRAETMIATADPAAVAELYRLVEAHPLRESLLALLMTALRRAGQDGEAIQVYDQARRVLDDRLGLEPSAALRQVRDEIVSAKPHLSLAPAKPGTLFGRDRELGVFRARLADLAAGRGGTVWLEGGPGAGKSALLAVAFADVAGRLLFSRLTDESFVDSVDQLTAAGPVVVVVDDLQDIEDSALSVWHGLRRLVRRSPLLLVGACRPVPRRTEMDRIRATVTSSGGDVLRLTGLSDDDTALLAADVLGEPPSDELLGVVDSVAGNPRFVREIVTGPPTPVIKRWLGLLSPETHEILESAARVGAQFDLAELAAARAVPATDLVSAVEEATDAGVLVEAGHRLAFRHPLPRAALLD